MSSSSAKLSRWPTITSHEMNLHAWAEELFKVDLLDEYEHILRGFEIGFDQGIPQHSISGMRYYCPPNHKSALLAKEEIEKNFELEVKEGRMFGPFDPEHVYQKFGFFRTSPLGAVVNGDKSTRPINDLSFPRDDYSIYSVNSFVNKEEFETTWDDFKTVAQFIKKSTYSLEFGIFDWAKAYRQIPTRKDQWPYLMLRDFNGDILIDTRVTFGGVGGCGSFGGPADAWKELMKAKFEFTQVFRWVDDNLFVMIANNPSNTSMKEVIIASELLGVKTNIGKYKEFDVEQKYIGFIWNGKEKTVRLPEEKRLQRIQEIIVYREEKTHTFHETEKIIGKLSHLTSMLPQMKAYLVAFYHWLSEWQKFAARRPIPPSVIDELLQWELVLKTFKPTRLIPDADISNVGWIGDASTGYGIGVIVGHYWTQLKTIPGWNEFDEEGDRREIAWLETIAVRIGIQMIDFLMETRGRRFLVLSDNSVTERAIVNKRSRNKFVNNQWKKIHLELVEAECDIHQVHVASADNTADELSRGRRGQKRLDKQLILPIPQDLVCFLEHESYK